MACQTGLVIPGDSAVLIVLLRRGFALEYMTLGWNVTGIVVLPEQCQRLFSATPKSAMWQRRMANSTDGAAHSAMPSLDPMPLSLS